MAVLQSEDTDCISSLAMGLSAGSDAGEEHPGQIWQKVDLTLISGARRFVEACFLCRHPDDEIAKLVGLLNELLDGKRDKIIFEPSEPSFELNLERTREGGFKAEIWIDSGNASTGFYRWDAAGIRFFTTLENLSAFRLALQFEYLKQQHLPQTD